MAKLSKLTDQQSVLRAIKEFDLAGRSQFLNTYKFGLSRDYFISYKGRYYDSKPITAAAYGYQYPSEGPLKSNDFSGGRNTVKVALERLRIDDLDIVSDPFQYLILAENEVYAQEGFAKWRDITGERYHFPNQYINHIVPGREFIYYKSSRRKSGRSEPEYFGKGRIGAVYPDPATTNLPGIKKHWLCEIEDYHPFQKPVPFQDNESNYLELGEKTAPRNYWRVGVRRVTDIAFQRILNAADIPVQPLSIDKRAYLGGIAIQATLDGLALLVPQGKRDPAKGSGTRYPSRQSGRAKEIGDKAENVALKWLRDQFTTEREREHIVNVAANGETPGWDIEDQTKGKGSIVAYEVKGTNGPLFPSIQVTANEWNAAERLGDRYNLILVAQCESASPRISILNNPWKLYLSGELLAEATQFRIERIDS